MTSTSGKVVSNSSTTDNLIAFSNSLVPHLKERSCFLYPHKLYVTLSYINN